MSDNKRDITINEYKMKLRTKKQKVIDLLNPYINTLNLDNSRVITHLKKIISKYKLIYKYGSFDYKISANKLISNKKTIIEIADYNYYHTHNIDKDHHIQKILKEYEYYNVIIVWYLSYNNQLYPILLSTYSRENLELDYTLNNQYLINIDSIVIDSMWISAGKTRNYMLNDPLIDYLEYNKIYDITDINTRGERSHYKNKHNQNKHNQNKHNQNNFLNILFDNGLNFEKEIMIDLYKRFPNQIVKIIDDFVYEKAHDPVFSYMTIQMMKLGVPIIYQGLLHDSDTRSYGLPDLIVRSDYINKIFKTNIELTHNIKLTCLGTLPYYIIDIKNSTIHLSSSSNNVLNHIGSKPFKGQISIYYQILNKIQQCDTTKAFILANKYTRKKNNIQYTIDDPFYLPGIIDYTESDQIYLETSLDAIKWNQLIRMPINKLDCVVPSNQNLYPNMCVKSDKKYNKVKSYLADKNFEITNLWNCGYKHRQKALSVGIDRWTNPKLNSKILGISGERGQIIDQMLKLNRQSKKNIYPTKIKSSYNDWTKRDSLAFYLDFETINHSIFKSKDWSTINDPESDFNSNNQSNDLIFMIGIGYSIIDDEYIDLDYEFNDSDFSTSNTDKKKSYKWQYKCMIVDDLSLDGQILIINQMISFINDICKLYDCNPTNTNIYHWSNFEQIILSKLCTKYNIHIPIYRWTDILKIFHDEPILIKGALNFSLKSVGKAMFKNKMINITWPESDCQNGLDAMYQSYQLYSEYENILSDKKISSDPRMIDILEYNLIDCKIMWAILNSLVTYS
jgi:hypothetical protein